MKVAKRVDLCEAAIKRNFPQVQVSSEKSTDVETVFCRRFGENCKSLQTF